MRTRARSGQERRFSLSDTIFQCVSDGGDPKSGVAVLLHPVDNHMNLTDDQAGFDAPNVNIRTFQNTILTFIGTELRADVLVLLDANWTFGKYPYTHDVTSPGTTTTTTQPSRSSSQMSSG